MNENKKTVKNMTTGKAATNVQRNAFQLTINNPLEKGIDHLSIKKTLVDNFSTVSYFCMADEIGENGTPHTHIYVHFTSRVRFSTVKKQFPQAHIEAAFGNAQSNREYVQKSGKWSDTEKAETSIAGTFEEWGTIPIQKGIRPDMAELYGLIKDGYTNSEILAMNNDHILYIDKLDKVRTMLLTEQFKGTRRLDLKVVYVCGETGTGKTRKILDGEGDTSVYRVTVYEHPFDSYACQPVLVFEEFRSSLRIGDMLNYCDIYPVELPARYANRYACYNTVYITSNWKLEDQYKEVQRDSPETWRAFLRRIHAVYVYEKDGSITTYDSVDEYMHRNEKFHSVSLEDECPFGTQEELPLNDRSGGNEQ